MINVLPAHLYKTAEILDTSSGVVYPKVLHLGEQLLTKIKWNHYNFDRSQDFMQFGKSHGTQEDCNINIQAHEDFYLG